MVLRLCEELNIEKWSIKNSEKKHTSVCVCGMGHRNHSNAYIQTTICWHCHKIKQTARHILALSKSMCAFQHVCSFGKNAVCVSTSIINIVALSVPLLLKSVLPFSLYILSTLKGCSMDLLTRTCVCRKMTHRFLDKSIPNTNRTHHF